MSDPQGFTAQQAADPATPAQTLADIAAQRPDLRPALASNPSTYQALLDWLGELGDPAVDAALAARGAGSAAGPYQPGASQPGTSQPGAAQPGAYQPGPAQPGPYQLGPAQPGPYQAGPAQEGWQSGGAQPWQPAPQPEQSWQQPQPGQGQPGAWQPGGAQPGPGQQWQSYGTPPPKKKGNTALVVVLIVVGVVIALGIAAFFVVRALGDRINEEIGSQASLTYSTTGDPQDPPPGEDAELDALWLSCQAEDWAACDRLYDQSPIDSQYEAYGGTCGFRTDGQNYCVEEFGG